VQVIACKDSLVSEIDVLCVERDVKLYTLTLFLSAVMNFFDFQVLRALLLVNVGFVPCRILSWLPVSLKKSLVRIIS